MFDLVAAVSSGLEELWRHACTPPTNGKTTVAKGQMSTFFVESSCSPTAHQTTPCGAERGRIVTLPTDAQGSPSWGRLWGHRGCVLRQLEQNMFNRPDLQLAWFFLALCGDQDHLFLENTFVRHHDAGGWPADGPSDIQDAGLQFSRVGFGRGGRAWMTW